MVNKNQGSESRDGKKMTPVQKTDAKTHHILKNGKITAITNMRNFLELHKFLTLV